jgi:voltage-gated potassium channel
VRALLRDRRVRSLVSLAAVLVFYFVVPIESHASTARLVANVLIALLCVALVSLITVREFRRMQLGMDLKFTGGQLLIVLEILLVVFSLTYFSLAIHGHDQMSGLHTRVDALYFTATTIATVGYGDVHSVGQLARVINTVQLVFDVLFIAAFVRLLSRAAALHEREVVESKDSKGDAE